MRKIGPGLRSILTPEGGIAIYLTNNTGAASIKGTLLNTESSEDNSVVIAGADEPDIIGAFYESGVPNGEKALVVIAGVADVLIEDSTASTRGYWCRISETQDGRADITNAAPPGGTIIAIEGHFREIGHSMENQTAGTDVLSRILMHFN